MKSKILQISGKLKQLHFCFVYYLLLLTAKDCIFNVRIIYKNNYNLSHFDNWIELLFFTNYIWIIFKFNYYFNSYCFIYFFNYMINFIVLLLICYFYFKFFTNYFNS